jgi:hypothetical protein
MPVLNAIIARKSIPENSETRSIAEPDVPIEPGS